MPKVSVIMNCYNGEKYLREAIDSVYQQTFSDWEIIFWDNASTDATACIVKEYDSKLRYFRSEKTISLGAARKCALDVATGEWVAFLDCDDYWFPHKLLRQLTVLESGDYVMGYAGVVEVTPDGKKIREVLPSATNGPMLEHLLNQFDINMVTPILRRSSLEEFKLNFDESITASEEYNLFVRLAAKGNICVVHEALGVWRILSGSLTSRQISKWGDERHYTLDCLERENPGISLRHPSAFREARARGNYYRARYLVSLGKVSEARATMSSIAFMEVRYYFLWASLFIPGLWGAIHKDSIKRRLLHWCTSLKKIWPSK